MALFSSLMDQLLGPVSNMLRGDSHPAWNPQASSNSPLPSFCYLRFHSQHSTFASMDSPPRWSFYFTFKHCLQRISETLLSPKEEIVTEEPWFVRRLQSSTFANTQGEAGYAITITIKTADEISVSKGRIRLPCSCLGRPAISWLFL